MIVESIIKCWICLQLEACAIEWKSGLMNGCMTLVTFQIDGKTIVMTRRSLGENIVELTQNGDPCTWFVFTKEISVPVSMSKPYDEIKNNQNSQKQ